MAKPKNSKASRNARRLMSALYINGAAIAIVAIGIIPIVVDQARSDETVWSWNPLSWIVDDFANLKILVLTLAVSLFLHMRGAWWRRWKTDAAYGRAQKRDPSSARVSVAA